MILYLIIEIPLKLFFTFILFWHFDEKLYLTRKNSRDREKQIIFIWKTRLWNLSLLISFKFLNKWFYYSYEVEELQKPSEGLIENKYFYNIIKSTLTSSYKKKIDSSYNLFYYCIMQCSVWYGINFVLFHIWMGWDGIESFSFCIPWRL